MATHSSTASEDERAQQQPETVEEENTVNETVSVDIEASVDADLDEDAVIADAVKSDDHHSKMRHRVEDYLEERRLQKELGDDFADLV